MKKNFLARKSNKISPNIYDAEAGITQSNDSADCKRTQDDNFDSQKCSIESLFLVPLSPITEENSIELKVIDNSGGLHLNRRRSSVSQKIEEHFRGQQHSNKFTDIIVEDLDM